MILIVSSRPGKTLSGWHNLVAGDFAVESLTSYRPPAWEFFVGEKVGQMLAPGSEMACHLPSEGLAGSWAHWKGSAQPAPCQHLLVNR